MAKTSRYHLLLCLIIKLLGGIIVCVMNFTNHSVDIVMI